MNNEQCLAVWRERIVNLKRKEITPGELSALFRQCDLQSAFFKLIDRDSNGSLSLEEWTGSLSKLVDASTADSDDSPMLWFVKKFDERCSLTGQMFIDRNDLDIICSDVEFGYRFATIISPRSRRVNCLQLITTLECIASMSTDTKWLSWLKYQFTEAMRRGQRFNKMELHVTLEDFMANFYFKEQFLAERLFSYLDKDKSGTLTLHEFIDGLEVVVNGSKEAKMEFLFKAFDVNGDGRLDYAEMRMMLKCCMESAPSLEIDETIDDVLTVLFETIDGDESGDISLDELKAAFKRNECLFNSLSLCTSVWIKPKYINKERRTNVLDKMRRFCVNNQPAVIFWTAYVLINALCMGIAYWNYATYSPWVICARMFGNSLNFNCALIVMLMLRKHITWLRIKGGAAILPLDQSIEIHRIVGIVILVESLVHTLAHLVNLYLVCMSDGCNYLTVLFSGQLSVFAAK